MDEATKYTLDFYEQLNETPRDVYLVMTYSELDTLVDIGIYHERCVAEKAALDATGAPEIVEASKDTASLSYAIGDKLFAEIHEKVLI